MIKRPFMGMFLMTVCGNLVGRWLTLKEPGLPATEIRIWFSLIAALIIVLGAVFLSKRKPSPYKCSGVFPIFILLGMGMGFVTSLFYSKKIHDLEEIFIEKIEQSHTVQVTGVITEVTEGTSTRQYHLASVRLIENKLSRLCPDLLVIQEKNQQKYPVGDQIYAEGNLDFFSKSRNDGGYDEECVQRGNGVAWKIHLQKGKIITAKSLYASIVGILGETREKIQSLFYDKMGEREAGILSAMCLGEKRNVDSQVKEQFQKAGISHVLAISGVHISILFLALFRRLIRLPWPKWMAVGTTILLLYLFILLTGGNFSAKRAGIMFIIFLMSQLLGRSYDGLNGVFCAGSVVLWAEPYCLEAVSFQYSVMAIIGVFIGRECVKRCYRSIHPILESLLLSGWITMCTLPLMTWHFSEFPLWGWIINLMVVPLVAPILMLGAMGGLAGWCYTILPWGVLEWLWEGILLLAQFLINLIVTIARIYGKIPGGVWMSGRPYVWQVITYGGIFLGTLVLVRRKRRMTYLFMMIPAVLLLACSRVGYTNQVTFLDVGQGDGIYLESKDGHNFMVDGGSSSQKQVGKWVIWPYLTFHGRKSIDYWFISHCDEDHVSGLEESLEEERTIRHIVFGADVIKNHHYEKIVKLAGRQKIPILYMEKGQQLRTEEVEITCITGKKEGRTEPVTLDQNANSMGILVRYLKKERAYLMAGDRDCESEMEFVSIAKKILGNHRLDVMKANHHGSKYSNSEVLLKELKPRYVVISYGKNNRYGHPHQEAIDRMRKAGAQILETAKQGQVAF